MSSLLHMPDRGLRLSLVASAILVLTASLASTTPAAAGPGIADSTPALELTRFQVPFESSQSLSEAVVTKSLFGYPVLGYRFENDEIVGEFSPSSEVGVDNYLADFFADYGTAPEVKFAIIEIPVELARKLHEDEARAPAKAPLRAEAAFEASPVDPVKIDALLAQFRARNPEKPEPRTARTATTWKPTQADIQVFRDSIFVDFSQYYYWDGSTARTGVMNSADGWEAEVNIYTSHPDFQGGERGGSQCPGAKDRPFAKNYNWTWSALVNTGSGMTTLASAANAYADYNDLQDACNRNSMAIGIRSPQAIPSYPDGMQEVLLNIQALRGQDETGRIGGVVQAVNGTWCSLNPWLSNTDCMGVGQSSSGNRLTLAEWRNWIAPNKCWQSFSYGDVAPDPYYCG